MLHQNFIYLEVNNNDDIVQNCETHSDKVHVAAVVEEYRVSVQEANWYKIHHY